VTARLGDTAFLWLNEHDRESTVRLIPSRRRTLRLLGVGLSALVAATRCAFAREGELTPNLTWVVFYGVEADPNLLSSFDVIVLDPAFQGRLDPFESKGSKLFGYISLGEISTTHAFMPLPKDRSLLLHENPNWPGTWRVDVRHAEWRSMVLDEAIPRLVTQGFRGLFLDTLDTPPYLEEIEPERYRGMRDAAIALVRDIKRNFPELLLIMNRGYALLGELSRIIYAVVAESLMTTYDFATQKYKWVEPNILDFQLELLFAVRARSPSLRVLTLDYWEPSDRETIRAIYEKERAFGHSPYVATIALNRIVPEPQK
jgi:uncharacterized protein (TIGR01370 family)